MRFRVPATRTDVIVLGGLGLALAVSVLMARPVPKHRPRHRVVVVGAGFGGLQAARTLAQDDSVDLCVIDQHNHHLFQPLLYQVATAALSPDDIARPIRDEIRASDRTHVRMGSVTGIDVADRRVICDGQAIPYDTLILATGSRTSYFGHKTWQQHTHGLKALSDAMALRQQILSVFERAAKLREHDPDRRRLLTFVLIGGGPTGVEMAGSIAELAGDEKRHDFGGDPNMRARVVLIEAGSTLLPHFPPDLSNRALADLSGMGVEVHVGTSVTDISAGVVHLGGDAIEAETIIWTAGVEASPVASWLGVAPARGGRMKVQPDLSLPGHPNVFVIGDAAEAMDRRGKPLPGLAPVAKQQGDYVAHVIIDRLHGRAAERPFFYQDFGTLATIGRNRAVAWFGRVHVTGFAAWVTWAVAHIFFLIGFRNRVLVGAQWMMSYVTHQRGGRIIT